MQPKLKWTKHKGGVWTVPQFPFFTLIVRENWIYGGRFTFDANSYPWLYEHYPQTYKTLEEAMIACEKSMLATIVKWQKEPNYTILKHTTWCGNTGNGKYMESEKGYSNKFKHQNYQWLKGELNTVNNKHIEPAIRFDITASKEQITAHAIKIHRRHCLRFIRLMQS